MTQNQNIAESAYFNLQYKIDHQEGLILMDDHLL